MKILKFLFAFSMIFSGLKVFNSPLLAGYSCYEHWAGGHACSSDSTGDSSYTREDWVGDTYLDTPEGEVKCKEHWSGVMECN